VASETQNMFKTFIAYEALAAHRVVKLHSTAGNVLYADNDDTDQIGVTTRSAAAGEKVTVRLLNAGGTVKIEASAAALAVNAVVYPKNDGKCDDATGGTALGRTLQAGAAGDIVEVLLN
jgi:hypothetical protein